MTPKEKAEELIEKFMDASIVEEEVNYYHPKPYSLARQCATIAVEEIINVLKGFHFGIEFVHNLAYWEQVKEEI